MAGTDFPGLTLKLTMVWTGSLEVVFEPVAEFWRQIRMATAVVSQSLSVARPDRSEVAGTPQGTKDG